MSWDLVEFPRSIRKTKIGRNQQVLSSEIKETGRFPVVDQGQEFIAGYSDEECKVIRHDLPLVVFGDHTRCVKYVDFPFIIGADGTKVLKPDTELFDPKFFYYALLNLNIPNRGYNRHFTVLKEKSLPRPEKDEQRKIAAVLGLVQQAIEQQERLIVLTTELKKVLLHKLFTEGLRGEPQKQTEIGPVPESWEETSLGSLVDIVHGFAFASRYFTSSGPVVLTPGNFKLDGGLYWGERTKFTSESFSDEYILHPKELVVVMTDLTPSAKLLGTPAFIPDNQVILHNQRIGKVILTTETIIPEFLYWVLLTRSFRRHMVLTATGSTVRHTSPSRIKDFKFALPPKDEQAEIANILNTFNRKVELLETKRDGFTELFRTLLHHLMTAEIRVDNLDLLELLPFKKQ